MEHAQKKTGSAGPPQNREKKTGERTGQIRVRYHTVLKKSAARQKNTGSAGRAQNREKKPDERTGQIRVRYHTVLKKSERAKKKTGSAGERTGQIRVGYHTVLKKKCCTPKKIRVRRVQHRTVKKDRVRERVKYGCDTIPSLKKVEHAQKKTGSAGPPQNREKKTGERTGQIRVGYHTVLKKSAARQKKIRVRRVQHRTVKKKRVRERVKYGCDTIPSLKKVNAQKKTGSAGERPGQIRVRYHTVLKTSAARQKRYGFGGSSTEPWKKNGWENGSNRCDTIPSLKKVLHAKKKYGFGGSSTEPWKKKTGERTGQIRVRYHTVLKKIWARPKKIRVGWVHHRTVKKRTGERTGQIRVRYDTVTEQNVYAPNHGKKQRVGTPESQPSSFSIAFDLISVLGLGYKIPRPHGTTTHTSFRVSMKGLHGLQNPPAPWNYYAYFI